MLRNLQEWALISVWKANTAIIDGVESFTGANVAAPDLRAGAALVIAALVADDFSVVSDIKYIQRGYEKFDEKLQCLGAKIEKVDTEKDIQKLKFKNRIIRLLIYPKMDFAYMQNPFFFTIFHSFLRKKGFVFFRLW